MIELMVVIVIGGILLSIAWVRLGTLVPIYRLEGAVRNFATDIQKARGRAIAEGRCYRVTITTATSTYQVERTPTSTCSGFAAVSGEGVRKIDDASSLTTAFSVGASPVFDSHGSATTTAAITLTNAAGATRTITVQSTGRVSVS